MKFKSRVACEMSISSLTNGFSSCFLWTFTTADTISPVECARRWNAVQRQLVRKGFFGVRVFELHPGGHGLHVHAIAIRRYDVNLIRGITSAYGFGRINVKRIPSAKSCYVAKYLSKQFTEEHPELKGVRLWARVGTKCSTWKGVKVSDIEVVSDEHSFFRSLWEASDSSQRNFRLARLLWQASRLVVAKIALVSHRRVCGREVYKVTIPHPVTGLPIYTVEGVGFGRID